VIAPGRFTLILALLTAVLLVAAIVLPSIALLAIFIDVALIGIVAAVGARLRNIPVAVYHEWPRRVQMGRGVDLLFRVENRGTSRIFLKLRQIWPEALEAATDTTEIHIDGGEVVRLALNATPRVRGTIPPSITELEMRFSADLARRRWQIPSPELVAYPNLKHVANYEQLQRNHAAAQIGIHQVRSLVNGREFEQLRDYFPDDDFRDINWKATAHHSRPITNMYRAERNQEIILCLDCGRMMGSPLGTGTVLDHAVDAGIMLAHVANRQGDRIGLFLFRDVVQRFVKPLGGLSGVNRIVEALVEAKPAGVFPSYTALVEALRSRQRRRAMVFLFTDLNDPQLASNMAEVLPLVSRRHVITVINLRDPQLEAIASGPAAATRDVFRVLAARELATERSQHTLSLIRSGVRVLDADATSLSLKLINMYLTLKARQVV
jgi:uncharacterized protein (DUF58 family)